MEINEVGVQTEIDPEDVTPELQAKWVRDMHAQYPWLSMGMADAIIDQWRRDPHYFQSDEFNAKLKEFAGRAQELRGELGDGGYEHLTGEDSDNYWRARYKPNIATCLPIKK